MTIVPWIIEDQHNDFSVVFSSFLLSPNIQLTQLIMRHIGKSIASRLSEVILPLYSARARLHLSAMCSSGPETKSYCRGSSGGNRGDL